MQASNYKPFRVFKPNRCGALFAHSQHADGSIQTITSQNTKRPDADFHPSIWGDYFLTDASYQNTGTIGKMKQQVEELKEEVKEMLMESHEKPLEKKTLELIDAIQRLGVAYHFDSEIDGILEKIYHHYSFGFVVGEDHDDLYIVALWFRLLRQHGYHISSDIFNKFKDGEGNFKASLTVNVPGMLSLYEAAHLRIRGEEILDEALAFTTTHLQSMVNDISHHLAQRVTLALRKPIRKNIPRLETRQYISQYPKEDSHNTTLLRLAELDFNVLQALHQEEVSNITRWYKNLDIASQLPYARDRVIEFYFCIMGVYFEPQYSVGRQLHAKFIAIASIIDDTYDAYGTYEELKLFTKAVKRWDISAVDVLPDYMKVVYQVLLDFLTEITKHTAKEGRSCFLHYWKQEVEDVVQAYLVEASWRGEVYTPTMEEYMSVGLHTAGCLAGITLSFLGMGKIATKEVFDWLSNKPKILKASSIIGRLLNDITTHKFEGERGHVASAVECYMKQHGLVEEKEAYKALSEGIENAWRDINEELLKPTAVGTPLLERVLNLSRSLEVMYDGDSYTVDSYTGI
ncbi:hypothetical protein FNV43_RR15088 [Rhamnella rubrinervis]|uniref:Uncharacterized protein n=1 Tax=Rhamnella rubrinervis TaxID=2594499 RepID=A0A8K0GWX4_9ROSA|nr:hypothetical protein FNV43_RR15088 [Rhamnella rubrinervis]